jgi:DNA-binding GntR family transcriptional regulator
MKEALSLMPARKVRHAGQPATLAQQVYEGLCQEITTGKLKPGELLSRRKIAAAYGTSYIPVIEAMVRLENAGLIETESTQMARVTKVTVESIENTYVLREALETQAIRLACETATEQEIEELYRLAEEVDARVSRPRCRGSTDIRRRRAAISSNRKPIASRRSSANCVTPD